MHKPKASSLVCSSLDPLLVKSPEFAHGLFEWYLSCQICQITNSWPLLVVQRQVMIIFSFDPSTPALNNRLIGLILRAELRPLHNREDDHEYAMCQRERSFPMSYMRITCSVFISLVVSLLGIESSAAIENVRVAYPSMGTSVFCLIIAQKEGYLKEEGLDAQLLSIRGEIAIRTTLAGEVDFFTNAGSALAAAVRGVPVKIVTV